MLVNPCLALFYIYKRRRPFLTYVNLHHRPKPPAPSLPIAGAIVQTSIPKVQPAFSSQTRPSPHRSAQHRNKKSPREAVIAHDTTPQDRRSPLFTTLSIRFRQAPWGDSFTLSPQGGALLPDRSNSRINRFGARGGEQCKKADFSSSV